MVTAKKKVFKDDSSFFRDSKLTIALLKRYSLVTSVTSSLYSNYFYIFFFLKTSKNLSLAIKGVPKNRKNVRNNGVNSRKKGIFLSKKLANTIQKQLI